MRRVVRKLGLVTVLALAIPLMTPSSASAAEVAGVGVVVGSGTIAPGIPAGWAPVGPQTVTFAGTLISAAVSVDQGGWTGAGITVTATCNFAGNNGQDNAAHGAGNVTGTCNGAAAGALVNPGTGQVGAAAGFAANCPSLVYIRTIAIVHVGGRCTVAVAGTVVAGPGTGGAFAVNAGTVVYGVFVFEPTSVNPVTSYLLEGVTVFPGG